jgi:hypothetical protein
LIGPGHECRPEFRNVGKSRNIEGKQFVIPHRFSVREHERAHQVQEGKAAQKPQFPPIATVRDRLRQVIRFLPKAYPDAVPIRGEITITRENIGLLFLQHLSQYQTYVP